MRSGIGDYIMKKKDTFKIGELSKLYRNTPPNQILFSIKILNKIKLTYGEIFTSSEICKNKSSTLTLA